MKTFFKYLSVFLFGFLFSQTPDLISLYGDHVISQYSHKYCTKEQIANDKCHFDMYFYKFQNDHKTLYDLTNYFQLGEGPLYWVLSRRCSNDVFLNPDATCKSGKITNRNYFFSRCSYAMNAVSDFIFRDGDKVQDLEKDVTECDK